MWKEFRKLGSKLIKVFFAPIYFKGDESTRNSCVSFSIISFIYLIFQIPLLYQVSFHQSFKHLTGLYLITTALHFSVYVLSRTGWIQTGSLIFALTLFMGVYTAVGVDPRIEVLLSSIPYLFISILVLSRLSTWKITLVSSVACAFVIINISYILQADIRAGFIYGALLFCTLATVTAYLKNYFRTRLEAQRIMSIYHSRLASLSEMGGGIAHEINNPLTIIQGYASQLTSMIQRKQLTNEKVIHAAEKIIETSERISKTVYKLRSFARDGENEPFREEQLKVIVESALDFCRARFRNHNIKIMADEINPDLVVNCRPVQLIQSIFNLLNNSFDAVQKLNDKWVQINVKEVGANIEIHVMDPGQGIPAEIASKMYDPFFTTKDVGQASGLGLSITSSLVNTHGGKIYLKPNSPNTCFVISLPKYHVESESENTSDRPKAA